MANWLPIPPRAFNIILRVYGPEGTVADTPTSRRAPKNVSPHENPVGRGACFALLFYPNISGDSSNKVLYDAEARSDYGAILLLSRLRRWGRCDPGHWPPQQRAEPTSDNFAATWHQDRVASKPA
jgi:hypothetical protein